MDSITLHKFLMITLFTRVLFLISLGACLCLGTGTALAQKSAPGKTKAQSKEKSTTSDPSPLGKAPSGGTATKAGLSAVNARSAARLRDNGNDMYMVLVDDSDASKKVLQELAATPGIAVKETDSIYLRALKGDPEMLGRLRMAYPEFVWMTADQYTLFTKTFQTNPSLANPEALEKLK